jgi:hypothetical protein
MKTIVTIGGGIRAEIMATVIGIYFLTQRKPGNFYPKKENNNGTSRPVFTNSIKTDGNSTFGSGVEIKNTNTEYANKYEYKPKTTGSSSGYNSNYRNNYGQNRDNYRPNRE